MTRLCITMTTIEPGVVSPSYLEVILDKGSIYSFQPPGTCTRIDIMEVIENGRHDDHA